MAEIPEGCVVHETSGRVRVRIPARRRDAAFFARIQRDLSQRMPKARIEANPATGSILIRCAEARTIIDVLGAEGTFRICDHRNDMTFDRMRQQVKELEESFRRWSGGASDARALIFVALVVGALYQAARGQMLAPAATLLWYAGEALRLWSSQDKHNGEQPGQAKARAP